MKYWLPIICIGSITFYCQADDATLNSTIKAVTVYADRAEITRQAHIALPAGQHLLRFKNLPAALNTNTIQLNVKGTTPAVILDVTTQQYTPVKDANNRLHEIEQQIQAINHELTLIHGKQSILTNQSALIKDMQEAFLTTPQEGSRPTAQEIKHVIDTTKIQLTQLMTELRALKQQKEILKTQLWVLQEQRTPMLTQSQPQVKDVVVQLKLAQAGSVDLDLNYTTPGASWRPSYDARFNTQDRKLSLNYQGIITQNTGEDWLDVKLTLSTAKPYLGGAVPTLTSWQIDESKPVVAVQPAYYDSARDQIYQEKQELKKATYVTSAAMAPTSPPVNMVVRTKEAVVDMGTTSASFVIEQTTSLNSGAGQQKVAITTLNLPSKLRYITVPRLQSIAYLQADTQNISNYPLIGGQLNIFMDNRFITSGQLNTTMPKEAFKLSLGADEAIAITYKQLSRFTENTGFTSSSEKITYEYLMTVQNNKTTTEFIDILDHIPISQNEKIKVVLLSPTPKDAQMDSSGHLTWKWQLAPGAKRETTLKFSVEYPVDTKVIGLH